MNSVAKNPLSVSIVVPAYNEEENLEATIRENTEVLKGVCEDYEFIIINDCSKDRTKEIADELAKKYPTVRVHHNEVNRGLGYNYRKGVDLAVKEYVTFVPGDNELKPSSVAEILRHVGKADLIIPYPSNSQIRPPTRQFLSRNFTRILNWITGHQIGYYNGAMLVKKHVLDNVNFDTNGFAFQAEILCQLLDRGYSYYQCPFELNYSSTRLTAFRISNVVSVVGTLGRMTVAYKLGLRGQRKLESQSGPKGA